VATAEGMIERDPAVKGTVQTAMVRSESLRFFSEVVLSLGGHPLTLFTEARLDPHVVTERDGLIPYRQMIHLLELAAGRLNCSDFGLRLAKRQCAEGILGPLDIAMRNSPTVGQAWEFCAEHVHTYSPGAHVALSRCRTTGRRIIGFEILIPRLYRQQQAVEHALLLSQLATRMFSGGKAAAREVWLAHEPPGDVSRSEYFGCPVSFAQPCNALFLDEADYAAPVVNRDDRVLELAAFFIDAQFPSPDAMIKAKVRIALEQQLSQGNCTQVEIAAALGMHPRTLQRRLREEGENFEAIKDEVRRDAAVRYLRQTRLPLKTIAGLLGYSELSVLYRSCHRWFGASPSAIRTIQDVSVLETAEGLTRLSA
jgi:AraC-like DNA-binding protein